MCKWQLWLRSLLDYASLSSDSYPDVSDKYSFKQMAQEACLELKLAQELLDQVADPDMIDYAVYSLKAAEKRFDYIIKKIREQEQQFSI